MDVVWSDYNLLLLRNIICTNAGSIGINSYCTCVDHYCVIKSLGWKKNTSKVKNQKRKNILPTVPTTNSLAAIVVRGVLQPNKVTAWLAITRFYAASQKIIVCLIDKVVVASIIVHMLSCISVSKFNLVDTQSYVCQIIFIENWEVKAAVLISFSPRYRPLMQMVFLHKILKYKCELIKWSNF